VDRQNLERLIRKVLLEELGETGSGVRRLCPAGAVFSREDRLDTGRAGDEVYTKDLLSTAESPRLGVGVMFMEKTTFPWTLNYDEVDYVMEGRLEIVSGAHRVSAGAGEVIFIPKGSQIEFSVPERAKFLYVTYPADWQNQG